MAASDSTSTNFSVISQGRFLLGRRAKPFERRLVPSHTTVVIPFDERVLLVSLLNGPQLSGRVAEVTQTLDAISWI
jgi:hypothetical protein